MSFATISTYIKSHENLLLVALLGLSLWFAIGRYDKLTANHDASVLKQTQVVAQAQADKNAALAVQATEQAAQYKALSDKIQAQDAALIQANATLATALTAQQHKDATLPPTELVQRLNTLVPSAGATVTPNGVTPSGVVLPEAGAVATVQALESVPVLSTQLENERTQLGNTQSLLTATTAQVATLESQVSGLNLSLKDNQAVCNQQITVIKAEARRSKRRWFYVGVVVGFVGRQLLKP
jgi:phage-related minor tail protein